MSRDNSAEDRERINYDYQALEHDVLVDAFEETYEIIRGIGNRTETTVIEVAPDLNGSSEHFFDHVHLTPLGSSHVARVVAKGLLPILSRDNHEFASPRQTLE